MERSFPASVGHYGQFSLMIVATVLLVLSIVVFPDPYQEIQWRLCMIGAFTCLLGCSRSPFWFVVNIFYLCWNFFFLAVLVWGK